MKLESLVEYCRSLPHIVEDIKWGNDRPQFIPTPCMARARWVGLVETSNVPEKEPQGLISRSHQLYFEKLSKKAQRVLLDS